MTEKYCVGNDAPYSAGQSNRAGDERLKCASARSERIMSIDVLRGLTILVMIFVNDVAGVAGVPAWMKHIEPPDADGMTFVDVVFPAFLFIVGMSIPLAIGRRIQKGESLLRIERHILVRTLSLLVIGVFMVNAESITNNGWLPRPVWILLVYAGIIVLWNRPSGTTRFWQRFDWGRRGAGVLILIAMAVFYRGDGEPALIEMRPGWWGVLGLIGWANLVASNVFLFVRNRIGGLVAAMALLYCLHFADYNGAFPDWWVFRHVDLASNLASLPAIVVAGVIAGVVLSPQSPIRLPLERIRWGLIYGAAMALAASLLHSMNDLHDMFFVSKIGATAPWGLWSSAITIWIWVLLYWIVDVAGWRRWTIVVAPAGQNSLFAYILVPILYASFDLWELVTSRVPFYWGLADQFSTGSSRSLVLAFGVTFVAGGLGRIGIQPKL